MSQNVTIPSVFPLPNRVQYFPIFILLFQELPHYNFIQLALVTINVKLR